MANWLQINQSDEERLQGSICLLSILKIGYLYGALRHEVMMGLCLTGKGDFNI